MSTPHSSPDIDRPSSALELQDLTNEEDRAFNRPGSASSLPPTDAGWRAWLFLFSCFMIEMILWGFPFSFGVLQDYYSHHVPISLNPNGISAVGTTCSGIMYLGAPLLFALCQWYPRQCRWFPIYGIFVVAAALALSSFATKIWHLLLTQGVLYASGGMFLYYPIFIFIDEWFVRRKGFAFGVMWGGSGCGGLAGPLVLNWGLSKYGASTFLRGWSIALVVLIAPLLYFVKPRLPPPRSSNNRRATWIAGFSFVKTRVFWILQIGNVVQGLGYFVPAFYLPSYARTLRFPPLTSSLLVSLLNVSAVPGVMLLSALSDRTNVTNVIFASTVGSAVSVFVFWGLSTASSLPLLLTFSVLYGFFAGGYTSTYTGIVRELRRIESRADLGSMFGLISMGRGVGNVACGPISELILGATRISSRPVSPVGHPAFAYATNYGPLVVFTGVTAALALTPWVTKRLHLI